MNSVEWLQASGGLSTARFGLYRTAPDPYYDVLDSAVPHCVLSQIATRAAVGKGHASDSEPLSAPAPSASAVASSSSSSASACAPSASHASAAHSTASASASAASAAAACAAVVPMEAGGAVDADADVSDAQDAVDSKELDMTLEHTQPLALLQTSPDPHTDGGDRIAVLRSRSEQADRRVRAALCRAVKAYQDAFVNLRLDFSADPTHSCKRFAEAEAAFWTARRSVLSDDERARLCVEQALPQALSGPEMARYLQSAAPSAAASTFTSAATSAASTISASASAAAAAHAFVKSMVTARFGRPPIPASALSTPLVLRVLQCITDFAQVLGGAGSRYDQLKRVAVSTEAVLRSAHTDWSRLTVKALRAEVERATGLTLGPASELYNFMEQVLPCPRSSLVRSLRSDSYVDVWGCSVHCIACESRAISRRVPSACIAASHI